MDNSSPSFQQAAWNRLRKNKGAMFGLLIIAIAVLVAIFAYFISPDSSPFANRIILEIGGKKPGYKQTFIKVKKDKAVATSGFFKQLIDGKEDAYYYTPIVSYEKKEDSIIVQKFIDEGLSERKAYHNSQLSSKPVSTQKFFLGTDKYGRDILSRLIVGTRVSLSVGLITITISLRIRLILGSLECSYRGSTDNIL